MPSFEKHVRQRFDFGVERVDIGAPLVGVQRLAGLSDRQKYDVFGFVCPAELPQKQLQ